MTAADRNRVRLELDARARAYRQALIDSGELVVCAGCGRDVDLPGVTDRCKSCWARRRQTERRGDPAYLAQERARQQRARDRRAERQRARREQEKSVGKSRRASVQRLVA